MINGNRSFMLQLYLRVAMNLRQKFKQGGGVDDGVFEGTWPAQSL